MIVGFASLQDRLYEMIVNHTVGEVLGFQTECASAFIGLTGLTGHTACLVVRGVELNTGLGG